MWQEAKKQEKILRGIMVDYKRRAERRKGFYDKIKKDPAEFLQLWGRQCKIHIDPNVAAAADNPSVMTKWRGDESTIIDRFDARSHLDFLVEYKDSEDNNDEPIEIKDNEERMLNYERYRTLVQNEAVGVSEVQCLKQIEIDEKFGGLSSSNPVEKKSKEPKAQIGFVYEDSSGGGPVSRYKFGTSKNSPSPNISDEENDEDLDLALDINKLTSEHKVIINKCATNYGMQFGDYVRMLILDNEEKETIIRNKLLEAEKAQYSGRKSRRERRIAKEKRLRDRGSLSPLSFIVKDEPEMDKSKEEGTYFYDEGLPHQRQVRSHSSSSSASSRSRNKYKRRRSNSPSNAKNKVLFITSFGAEDQEDQTETNNFNINKNAELLLKKNKTNVSLFNAELLKNKESSMSPRSPVRSRSLSRSSTPVKHVKSNKNEGNTFKQKFNTSKIKQRKTYSSESSESENSSDEDAALKNYLKRRESRKQNIDTKPSQSNNTKNGSNLTDNKNSNNKINDNKSLSSKNSNLTKDDTASYSKFRSADEFKVYQEKLKKKMQKQINEQLKKDQKVEKEKRRKEYDERKEREAKLIYLTEKMRERRKKERKRRREAGEDVTSSTSDSDRSRSRISSSRSRSRSRSRSSSSQSRSRMKSYVRQKSRSKSKDRSRERRKISRSRSRSRNRDKTRMNRSKSKSPIFKKSYSRNSRSSSRSRSRNRRSRKSSTSSSSSSSSTTSSSKKSISSSSTSSSSSSSSSKSRNKKTTRLSRSSS